MTGLAKYKGLLYLIGLLIVVPWLAYRITISDTVKMNRAANRTEREIDRLQVRSQQESLNSSTTVSSSRELQNGDPIPQIMDSDAGGRCTVVKYTPYITENRDGLAVHTAELTLQGSFADLVRLTERAETILPSCRLVSTSFKSIRQRQRKQTLLQATLILQQITNSEK